MSRIEQAIHYVIHSTRPDELGRTKLAKVLFFADLDAYRRTGKPITEATYEKRPHGPMPRELYDVLGRLKISDKIAERHADHYGRTQHQFWALTEPDLDKLTAHDVATLSGYTREICENYTATDISDLSHNDAWKFARLGEEIPFAAFLVASGAGEPTDDELDCIEAVLGA